MFVKSVCIIGLLAGYCTLVISGSASRFSTSRPVLGVAVVYYLSTSLDIDWFVLGPSALSISAKSSAAKMLFRKGIGGS